MRELFVALALLALCGCSAYEAALLNPRVSCGNGRLDADEACDPEIEPGNDGACPDECPASGDACAPALLVGSGCQRRCVVKAIVAAVDGDGCCPAGLDGMQDRDCARCGDGIVGPGESCDPPSNCLTAQTCVSPDPCLIATFSGEASRCNARCELAPITVCRSGDGCCPANCGQASDRDCSPSCGDGVVDPQVETCEPTSETQPCKANCDDGNSCTTDLGTGSASNCNLDCTHVSITVAKDGDGCCPPDATALNDRDCKPVCGNGLVEPGEECDGQADCTKDCLLRERGQCRDALAAMDSLSDECKACACESCVDRVLGCLQSPEAADNARCRAVIDCTARTGCGNGTCYCGSSLSCSIPSGVCRQEIEMAAGTTLRTQVLACASDPQCPGARAFAHDACLARNCAQQCGRSAGSTAD